MKLVSSDSECMARLAAGDGNALRELYQRHGRALLRFSSAMCRSRQAAEDMVHDTFVALMREPISFDPAQGTVFGYLCGVLRHRVSRHFRQQKRWVALDTDSDTSRRCTPAMLTVPPMKSRARKSPPRSAARCSNCRCNTAKSSRCAISKNCHTPRWPASSTAPWARYVRACIARARLLTIRLASLELIDLESEPPMAHRGLS